MEGSKIEIKSAGGHVLLDGEISPNDGNGTYVSVYVDGFIHLEHLEPSSVAREVEAVAKIIKGLNIIKEVYLTLSSDHRATPRGLDATVAMPIVQAYRESSASELIINLDLGVEDHISVIRHDDCKDTVTILGVYGHRGSFGQKQQLALESLSELRSLILVRVPAWNQFLACLTNVSFSETIKAFHINEVQGPDEARSIVELLKKHPQIEELSIENSSDTQAHSLLLKTLHRDSGVNLKVFDCTINDAATITDHFIAALEMAILNLSPQLQSLSLNLAIDDNTTDQLKPRIFSAMKQNTSTLALDAFDFETTPNVDQEILQQCSAFVAKNKIFRATTGKDRMPLGALSLALDAIKNHPHMNPQQSSASFLYEALRSNNELQDLIENAVNKKKSLKRKQGAEDSTANLKAAGKRPKN